jgi:hypothetical protein
VSASPGWLQSTDWRPHVRLLHLDRRWTHRKKFLAHVAFASALQDRIPAMAKAVEPLMMLSSPAFGFLGTKIVVQSLTDRFQSDARFARWSSVLTSKSHDPEPFAAAIHFTIRVLATDGIWTQSPTPAEWLTHLFREMFTETPIAIRPEWRTTDVLDLAGRIDRDREFEAMPILGDLLAEAGCTDDMILGHCRGPNGHHRGCWLIDAVLGRE